MDKNSAQAHAVINELQEFETRIDAILERIKDKRSVTQDEKEDLQELLRLLKKDLKAAAKHSPTNNYEKAFLSPAVSAGSVNLTVAVNSHPINSNWYSCLYGVRIDIDHMLVQLRQEFPAAQCA